MNKKLPEVHLDFITPTPGIPRLRNMVNYASSFLGIDHKRLLRIIRGEQPIFATKNLLNSAAAFLGFNKELYNVGSLVKNIYKFKNNEIALHYFLSSQETSTKLINYLINLYGFDRSRFGLKDEVSDADPSLRRMFVYMNPSPNHILNKGTAPRTRFEQLRELLLCDLALRNTVRGTLEEPLSKISELKQRFNNELYEGQAGAGEQIEFHVVIDQENGASNVTKKQVKKRAERKIEEMRAISIGNKKVNVQVDFDTKANIKKVIKLLADFHEKGISSFDPAGMDPHGNPLLEDRQRFSVVVYGNDQDISSVHDRINTFFENIKEKRISTDHGQNPTVKKRYIADYKGVPFEILYYDEKGWINSEKHIGKIKQIEIPVKIGGNEFTAEFNIFNGSAHELYELRRSLALIFLLFPYEIYKRPGQSEKEYMDDTIETVEAKNRELVHKLRSPTN